MSELLTLFLKNIGCSHCQEYEFQENYNKENLKSWKLYLKKYEMYSAMILHNSKLNKDISYLISKSDSLLLLNEDGETYIKLEYISNNDDDKTAILVPTDEYQKLYEEIESMDKKFDKKMNAYYIGKYDIKKCK